MWANRRSITSAARPDARAAVLAALLLLPSASPAASSRDQDALTGDAQISKTLSNSAVGDGRIGTEAVEPIESEHFTLLTVKKGVERNGVLQTAYTSFMAVTTVPLERMPAHVRVVIYRKQGDYWKVTRSKARWRYSDGEIATFEQKNMNSELVKAVSALLFDHAAKAEGRKELAWLRGGVQDAVEAMAAHVPPDERQAALRQELKTVRPVGINEMVRQKLPVSKDQNVSRSKRKKGRQGPAAAKRLRLTGVCLTYYLMAQDKSLSFSFLLKELSDGKHLDDALSSAYPGKVRGLQELYDRWMYDEVGAVRPAKNAR